MIKSANSNFLVRPLPKNVMFIPEPTPYDMFNYVTNAIVEENIGLLQKGDIIQFHNSMMQRVAEQQRHLSAEDLGLAPGYFWILKYEPDPYSGIYGYFRGLNSSSSSTLHALNHEKLMSHFNLFPGTLLIDRHKDFDKTNAWRNEVKAEIKKGSILGADGMPISGNKNKKLLDTLATLYIYQKCGTVKYTAQGMEKYLGKQVLLAEFSENFEKIGDVLYNCVNEEDVVAIM